MQETQVWFLGREDPLEEEIATHSSMLAWKIPWTEELGGLQSMGSQRVGHTEHICGEGNSSPLQYSCLENPVDRGAWLAAVHAVAQSRTRLKRLSSSCSSSSRAYKTTRKETGQDRKHHLSVALTTMPLGKAFGCSLDFWRNCKLRLIIREAKFQWILWGQ